MFLVLLDLSAAFDTVAHPILLSRMKTKFGVADSAHKWLTSYLEDRTQSVVVEGLKSSDVPLTCGVPQGSVLGPDLFMKILQEVQFHTQHTPVNKANQPKYLVSEIELCNWKKKTREPFHIFIFCSFTHLQRLGMKSNYYLHCGC